MPRFNLEEICNKILQINNDKYDNKPIENNINEIINNDLSLNEKQINLVIEYFNIQNNNKRGEVKDMSKKEEGKTQYNWIIGLSKKPVAELVKNEEYDAYVYEVIDEKEGAIKFGPDADKAQKWDEKYDANYIAGIIKEKCDWGSVVALPIRNLEESEEKEYPTNYQRFEASQEFDYKIKATMPVKFEGGVESQQEEALEELENQIYSLLENEDYMKETFPEIALGYVFGFVNELYLDELTITFGICAKDADEEFTTKDLCDDAKEFMNTVFSNIDNNVSVSGLDGFENPKDDYDAAIVYANIAGEIKTEVIKEPENLDVTKVEGIDKKLVSEGQLKFKNESSTKNLVLTDDGIVELYENNDLKNQYPFSKKSVVTECAKLISEGYLLEDENIDIEKTKQDLEQGIEKVDELQNLKDELESKVDTLMNESVSELPEFPSSEFSSKKLTSEELNELDFNNELNDEQKDWINKQIGDCNLIRDALIDIYALVDNTCPPISIDRYISILIQNNIIKGGNR